MYRLLPLVVLIAACGPEDSGPSGFDPPTTTNDEGSCVLVEERAVLVDEMVGAAMNFSAENALSELTGVTNHTNVFEYPSGDTIDVEVLFTYTDGAITYRERDAEGALSLEGLDKCYSAIEISGMFEFATGDGLFLEQIPGELQALKRREGRFTLDVAAFVGTWTPADSDIDSAAHPTLSFEFDGWIDPSGSGGTVEAISGTDRLLVGDWAPPPSNG